VDQEGREGTGLVINRIGAGDHGVDYPGAFSAIFLLSLLKPFSTYPSLYTIYPSLGFPSNPDNTDVNQLNTFAHSPSNFDCSSLGDLSSPTLAGFASSLNTGTGSHCHEQEPLQLRLRPLLHRQDRRWVLTLESDVANAGRRRKDVQDLDVVESENQIHQLIDDLGPFLLSGTGLSGLGLGPAVQMNGGSTMMPSMNEVMPTMKHVDMLNAASSHSTTTKKDGIGDRTMGWMMQRRIFLHSTSSFIHADRIRKHRFRFRFFLSA